MVTWTLAKKNLRLLVRDPKASVILLAMPFIWMLVLGFTLGEGFGQKPDDRLRVSIVDLDQGQQPARFREAVAWLAAAPPAGPLGALTPAFLAQPSFPAEPWAKVVQRDLAQTAGIRVEVIDSLEE